MIGLILILLCVFILPFTVKVIEKNLEVFLFFMGTIAVFMSGVFNEALLVQALKGPINITLAVVIAGISFKWFKAPLGKAITRTTEMIPFPVFIFLNVVFLGLLSSIITAIIAALVLMLIVTSIHLRRESLIRFVVIACFSIGLGAALTPIGEPLSTITVSRLNADFFYLMELIGPFVIPGIILLGVVGAILVQAGGNNESLSINQEETLEDIFVRGLKIYFFVMGLTFLGSGFEPLINTYLLNLNPLILYWINIISAVLDNATLAAAEISIKMTETTLKSILLGLLISGGMLIPGNIPNIIAAGKLNISSKEWAKVGVPLGLIMMFLYYIILLVQ